MYVVVTPVNIASRCIAAKFDLGHREAEYMKGCKQGNPEILFYFNGIHENLNHCATEFTSSDTLFKHILTRDMWTW